MTAQEVLEKGLGATGLPYAEEKYHGKDKTKYLTYIEEDIQDRDYADNNPTMTQTYYQVHYFCPSMPRESDDSRKVTVKIKKELRKLGFCFSGVVRRIEDNDRRHVIISCNVKTKNMEE